MGLGKDSCAFVSLQRFTVVDKLAGYSQFAVPRYCTHDIHKTRGKLIHNETTPNVWNKGTFYNIELNISNSKSFREKSTMCVILKKWVNLDFYANCERKCVVFLEKCTQLTNIFLTTAGLSLLRICSEKRRVKNNTNAGVRRFEYVLSGTNSRQLTSGDMCMKWRTWLVRVEAKSNLTSTFTMIIWHQG